MLRFSTPFTWNACLQALLLYSYSLLVVFHSFSHHFTQENSILMVKNSVFKMTAFTHTTMSRIALIPKRKNCCFVSVYIEWDALNVHLTHSHCFLVASMRTQRIHQKQNVCSMFIGCVVCTTGSVMLWHMTRQASHRAQALSFEFSNPSRNKLEINGMLMKCELTLRLTNFSCSWNTSRSISICMRRL